MLQWRANPNGVVYYLTGQHGNKSDGVALERAFKQVLEGKKAPIRAILMEGAEATHSMVRFKNAQMGPLRRELQHRREKGYSDQDNIQWLRLQLAAKNPSVPLDGRSVGSYPEFDQHVQFLSIYYGIPLKPIELYSTKESQQQKAQSAMDSIQFSRLLSKSTRYFETFRNLKPFWEVQYQKVAKRSKAMEERMRHIIAKMSVGTPEKPSNFFAFAGSAHEPAFSRAKEKSAHWKKLGWESLGNTPDEMSIEYPLEQKTREEKPLNNLDFARAVVKIGLEMRTTATGERMRAIDYLKLPMDAQLSLHRAANNLTWKEFLELDDITRNSGIEERFQKTLEYLMKKTKKSK